MWKLEESVLKANEKHLTGILKNSLLKEGIAFNRLIASTLVHSNNRFVGIFLKKNYGTKCRKVFPQFPDLQIIFLERRIGKIVWSILKPFLSVKTDASENVSQNGTSNVDNFLVQLIQHFRQCLFKKQFFIVESSIKLHDFFRNYWLSKKILVETCSKVLYDQKPCSKV